MASSRHTSGGAIPLGSARLQRSDSPPVQAMKLLVQTFAQRDAGARSMSLSWALAAICDVVGVEVFAIAISRSAAMLTARDS